MRWKRQYAAQLVLCVCGRNECAQEVGVGVSTVCVWSVVCVGVFSEVVVREKCEGRRW